MASLLFGAAAWASVAILAALLRGVFRRLGKARMKSRK